MNNNTSTKTRAQYLHDPATSHPHNRPRSTWSESDEEWMKEEAKIQAQNIAKTTASRGTDSANTEELQRKVMEELLRITPQSQSTFIALISFIL